MQILINGLPLFGKRLARDLQEAEPESGFRFYDTYYSKWDQLRFFAALPFADAVISMNGVTDPSGSLDAVLLFRKKLIMQWQGTDALLAVQRNTDATIFRKYIQQATHWVDAPWIFQEVESIGLRPEYSGFKYATSVIPRERYEAFSVVSYVPQKRQTFYGLETIKVLAMHFQDVPFHLYGCNTTDLVLPPNVHLHGWVEEVVFKDALRNNAVYLRFTEHDGFSISVIEAMSAGCEVIMSMPYKSVYVARNIEEALHTFKLVKDKVEGRGLIPNPDLVKIVHGNFKKEEVIANYLKKLHQVTAK